MNRKLLFVCLVFALVFTGMLTAKSIGLDLEVGGAYNNHQLHRIGSSYGSNGFRYHGISSKSLGGFNIGISYPLPKNWAVFANTTFTFNNIFVNDTMLGVGYIFKPGKGFELLLGGAFAFGGSAFQWASGGAIITESYFNLGGGINLPLLICLQENSECMQELRHYTINPYQEIEKQKSVTPAVQ